MNEPTTTRYADCRHDIWIGDMLLFRRKSAISKYSEGPYSHAAMATWYGNTLLCVESREWHGGRAVTLSSQVEQHRGCIDVYRPKISGKQAATCAEICVRQTGHDYNYRGILWASILRMPIVRAIYETLFATELDPTADLKSAWHAPKFCSQLVAWCYRAVGFDAVPNMADSFITPNHLGHSAGFVRVFGGLV